MGLGPVILRCGLFVEPCALRCWELGRGEGVGVACIYILSTLILDFYFTVPCDSRDAPYPSRANTSPPQ
jgi:hypothetical protein